MKLLQTLLCRLTGKTAAVKIIAADSPDLRLTTWRENEPLVAEWAQIVKLPIFRVMLQTLKNESPLHYGEEKPGADGKILRLGTIEGYQLALNNLESLATLAQQQKPLVATFEPPAATESDLE
jgi:hypothetical protein